MLGWSVRPLGLPRMIAFPGPSSSRMPSSGVLPWRQLPFLSSIPRSLCLARRDAHELLGLSAPASRSAIKARFRLLAKRYHPDLGGPEACEERMSELLVAYDELLFAGERVGGSAIARDCEIFTLEELKSAGAHDVHELRVMLSEAMVDGEGVPGTPVVYDCGGSLVEGSVRVVHASLADSVSDLKRRVQHEFEDEWDLRGRRQDADRLAVGWELVHNGSAMSYHLFLDDYNIAHLDTLHAVIKRATGGEEEEARS